MIAYLRGKILSISHPLKKNTYVIIEVQGVGYEFIIPLTNLGRYIIGEEKEVFIYHHIWEGGQELFGFLTQSQVDFFKILIGISGIGPKSALHIISNAKMEDIQKAVMHDDPDYLAKTGSLSKKTAEKIILGLRDHMKDLVTPEKGETIAAEIEVIEALASLGFSREQTQDALSKISKEIKSSDEMIKEALKILGKK